MKKNYLLLLLLSTYTLYGQVDSQLLLQDWFITKVNMKDGSRIFLKPPNDMQNFGFRFEKKIYTYANINRIESKSTLPISYHLKNNEIISSPGSALLIEKLTPDSLILSQKIENMSERDLLRYHMVPLNKIREQLYEENKEKDTLLASALLGPVFLNRFDLRTVKILDGSKSPSKSEILPYKFNGEVFFDLTNKKIDVIIEDNNDDKVNKLIQKKIDIIALKKNWSTSGLQDFKYVKVPFSFIHYYENTSDYESFGDVYTFYSKNYNDAFITEEIGMASLEESQRYYESGVKEFTRKNYKEAFTLFAKSIKANKRNLNAYYNFAMLAFLGGDKKIGCDTYKFLKAEGQIDAEKLYSEKCSQ